MSHKLFGLKKLDGEPAVICQISKSLVSKGNIIGWKLKATWTIEVKPNLKGSKSTIQKKKCVWSIPSGSKNREKTYLRLVTTRKVRMFMESKDVDRMGKQTN